MIKSRRVCEVSNPITIQTQAQAHAHAYTDKATLHNSKDKLSKAGGKRKLLARDAKIMCNYSRTCLCSMFLPWPCEGQCTTSHWVCALPTSLLHWFSFHLWRRRSLHGKLCDLRHACLLQRVNNHHHSFIFPTPSVHPPLHLCQMWHYVFSLMIFQLYCFSKEMTAGKPPCTWSSTELWGLWQRKGCLGKRPREMWLSCSLCKSSISKAAT